MKDIVMNNGELARFFDPECGAGQEFLSGKSLAQAWTECPRGDWLLWGLRHLGIDKHMIAGCTARTLHILAPANTLGAVAARAVANIDRFARHEIDANAVHADYAALMTQWTGSTKPTCHGFAAIVHGIASTWGSGIIGPEGVGDEAADFWSYDGSKRSRDLTKRAEFLAKVADIVRALISFDAIIDGVVDTTSRSLVQESTHFNGAVRQRIIGVANVLFDRTSPTLELAEECVIRWTNILHAIAAAQNRKDAVSAREQRDVIVMEELASWKMN